MGKILLLEDDREFCHVLGDALERAGHRVFGAFDGSAGTRIISKEALDIVVVHIFLPDKDGLEIIRELRAERPDVKIIAISGGGRHSKETYLKAAMLLGAQLSIKKPFEPRKLIKAVEALLIGN